MPIASRTPEGWPNRCPICGAELRMDPSIPPGDAPCPQCGHLLWFDLGGARRRVLEVIASIVHRDPDALDLGSPVNNLGGDSLDTVELIMELEEEFEIALPDDDLPTERILTLRTLIEWIVRSLGRRPDED
jgi:acyl carrier protein